MKPKFGEREPAQGARRCGACGLFWPADERFALCPVHKVPLVLNHNQNPSAPRDEMISKANHAEFEHYYERTRGIPVDSDEEPKGADDTIAEPAAAQA